MNKDLQKLYTYLKKAIIPPETNYTLSPEEIKLILNFIDQTINKQ